MIITLVQITLLTISVLLNLLSINIHTLMFISSFTLILQLNLHLFSVSFHEFILFTLAFLNLFEVQAILNILLFFLTFQFHTKLFSFFLPTQLTPSAFLIFFKKSLYNHYFVFSYSSNCLVSSFFNAKPNASFALELESKYLAAYKIFIINSYCRSFF
jgi:hypothetical protein